MPENTPDLNAAYALETPDDSRRLYADWAQTYDQEFATDMQYRMPQIVAMIYAENAVGSKPVLDVGAGTGLLAQAIPMRASLQIDALDISPDMLQVAMDKGVYRNGIEADLTQILPIDDGVYGAVVSAVTFTHGHVGPNALDELLRIAKSGALFVLGINAEHYVERGFEAKFAALEPQIADFQLSLVNIYGVGADDAHKNDLAQVALFSKR